MKYETQGALWGTGGVAWTTAAAFNFATGNNGLAIFNLATAGLFGLLSYRSFHMSALEKKHEEAGAKEQGLPEISAATDKNKPQP
ncbi:MAG: hypothetical protein KKA05_02300 [Alphaproteobacteria bacterium]|nr:hypothetical protein [Alphaproteobacteria bacterium]MBU0860138.1 hypothetical protein [Alphaproteobacteria bacterium]